MQIFAPMQHARAGCHVRVSRDDFKIIGHEKDPYLLLLKESIVITTSGAQLNGNIASVYTYLDFSDVKNRKKINRISRMSF